MRVLVVLLMLCSVAYAAPTLEGRAIVFVVDRGLSAEKIEVVREAVQDATYYEDDRIGVVAYAAKATVILPFGGKTRGKVRTTAEPTNLDAGLEAARTMLAKSKQARLVIVFTDRDAVAVEPALAKLRTADITVSVIGVETANASLAKIARAGNGRHYATETTDAVAIALQKELNLPPPDNELSSYVFLIEQSTSPMNLEAAKELVRQRAEGLDPNQMIAVIGIDTQPTFYVRPQRAANRMRISSDVWRVKAGGGAMDIPRALKLALETQNTINAHHKHVVLFGRGHSTDAADVAKAMANANITVSAVGLDGANRELLEKLVAAGGGTLEMIGEQAPGARSLRMR